MGLRSALNVFVLLALIHNSVSAVTKGKSKLKWGYINKKKEILPNDWHLVNENCNGLRQSPINIQTSLTTFDAGLSPIIISKHADKRQDDTTPTAPTKEMWTIKNNGHGVEFIPKESVYKIRIHPENAAYTLAQMHFHWNGSEHTINGINYIGEMHLVHNSDSDKKKLAVIGFFLALSTQENVGLKPIFDKTIRVDHPNEMVNTSLELNKVIPFRIDNYFRYSGSLTTPACDEIVKWFVVDQPVILISQKQFDQLKVIRTKTAEQLVTNSRPLQPLNEREVRRSFKVNTFTKTGYNNKRIFMTVPLIPDGKNLRRTQPVNHLQFVKRPSLMRPVFQTRPLMETRPLVPAQTRDDTRLMLNKPVFRIRN